MFLLTPGPSECLAEVLDVLGEPIPYHRSPEFGELYFETHELLKRVFQTEQGEVLIYNGSGTLGMDLSVASFFEKQDEVLVISVGNFGDRYIEICTHYGLHVHTHSVAWGQTYDLEVVKTLLDEHPHIKGVFVTHCETSTGVLNDIAPLGSVCAAHDCLLIVDTISGLVMNPFDFDGWGVDVAIAASQKGFYMPPGLCMMALSPKAQHRVKPDGSYYLGIQKNLAFLRNKQIFTTVNTPYIKALHLACTYILENGLAQTQHFYETTHATLKQGLQALGYEAFLEDHESKSLLVMKEKNGVDTVELLAKQGILIGKGMKELLGTTIRFGNMNATSLEVVQRVLTILQEANKGEHNHE
ncbi:MAG: pyridoxal-phosphate-dependent aminotransferase family protein [Erysipelotrichaceae bacterium]